MREILFRTKRVDNGEWVCGKLTITAGQYTGLTDKNGKKIFEGDIVEYKEEYGEIAYDDKQAMFIVQFDTWCTDFDHIYPYELEIIGNIHDNPELLEGE